MHHSHYISRFHSAGVKGSEAGKATIADCLKQTDKGVLINIEVVTGADESRVSSINPWRNSLHVHIAARPVKGKANAEITAFFADALGVSQSDVVVARGELSNHKVIRVGGLILEEAEKRLEALMDG